VMLDDVFLSRCCPSNWMSCSSVVYFLPAIISRFLSSMFLPGSTRTLLVGDWRLRRSRQEGNLRVQLAAQERQCNAVQAVDGGF